jgi:hypothetical protein
MTSSEYDSPKQEGKDVLRRVKLISSSLKRVVRDCLAIVFSEDMGT